MNQATIQAYDLEAKNYDDETADFWERFPPIVINEFSKRARRKVIDIGSGPGRDGLILQKLGHDITCVDASKTMVDLCLSKGLKAFKADFLNLPFPSQKFDAAWAYTSLLHVQKMELPAALSEVYRIIKPNGVLGLGMIEGNFEDYLSSQKVKSPRFFAYYTKKELDTALKTAEFEILFFHSFKPRLKNYLNYIAQKRDGE